jgi:uncharacterized protein YjiS (DUF1127 family)
MATAGTRDSNIAVQHNLATHSWPCSDFALLRCSIAFAFAHTGDLIQGVGTGDARPRNPRRETTTMNVELIRPTALLALLAETATGRHGPGRLTQLGRRLAARLGEARRYLTTVSALRRLGERELDDLGITRAGLKRLARAHARQPLPA